MYTQAEIEAAYMNLITQGHSPEVAEAYLTGVVAQAQQPTPRDPRLDEMHADWQQQREQQAYDAIVNQIAAANPDVDERRFHLYVSAAEGDFNKALELYRADTPRLVEDLGLARHYPDELEQAQARLDQTTHPAATPQQRLNNAIDMAAAISRGRR